MNQRAKRATAAAGAAAVLAAGVYGVATQAGHDSAEAAGKTATRAAGRGPGPDRPRLADLASRLGVSEAKLRAALLAIRPDRDGRHGPEDHLLAPLAKELGVSEAKLRAAFDELRASHDGDRSKRRSRVAAAVAKFLGLDASRVEAALPDAGPGPGLGRFRGGPPRPGERRDQLDAAAKKLGVTPAKLRSALRAARQDERMDRPDRGTNPMAAALAKALGIDADKVEKAFDTLRSARRDDRSERRDAFAAKLAKQLGIPEAKVKSALPDGPFLRGRGHHGPGDHGPGDHGLGDHGPGLDGP